MKSRNGAANPYWPQVVSDATELSSRHGTIIAPTSVGALMALRFITNHMDGVSVKLPRCDVCSPIMSTLEAASNVDGA